MAAMREPRREFWEQWSLADIHPGRSVCDRDGVEVGHVAHIHQPTGDRPSEEAIIEVKTGLFGLGRHLYVPVRAIQTVTPDAVLLQTARAELAEHQDWYQRPGSKEAA